MHTAILVLAALLAIGQQRIQYESPPIAHFAFYAPAQEGSPVRIVSLQHDRSELQFVLLNASDKPVSAVFVGLAYLVPRGCGLERSIVSQPTRRHSTIGFELKLAPHGRTVATKVGILAMSTLPSSGTNHPHLPIDAVYSASHAGAAYMQVQFGVTAVFFQDGTAWPTKLNYFLRNFDALNPSASDKEKLSELEHPDAFDPALAEAEAGKCTDVATVANALQSVNDVIFGDEIPPSTDPDEGALPPHLRFSCSLEGEKATCRMPLETNHTAAPLPDARSQR